MPVIINDETHYEGIDLTETSFYESLTGGKNISTSQPSPGDLMDLWDDIFEQGYDEIIHIPMSSGLSASCSSAISLSADYEGKVQVADNHRISVTQRESVMHAKKLAEAGKSAKEIKEILPHRYPFLMIEKGRTCYCCRCRSRKCSEHQTDLDNSGWQTGCFCQDPRYKEV